MGDIHFRFDYASDYPQATADAFNAGVDLDCGDVMQRYTIPAINEKYICFTFECAKSGLSTDNGSNAFGTFRRQNSTAVGKLL